ncbi:MAG: hypothetical protein WBF89_20160, partial [Steroidobacteraceae bacterium]
MSPCTNKRASPACAAVAVGLAALAAGTPSFGQSAPPPPPTLPSTTPDLLSLPQRAPARAHGPDVAPSSIPARVTATPPASGTGSASA